MPLALLEHALDQLWSESKGEPPTFADYQRIGRLKGALRAHADRVMADKLKIDAQREMARRIFVELTALGEGTEDSARRVPKAKLLSPPGRDADAVLQILADERLVTIGDADDPEAVAIAHEALIREWESLRGWVDKRRQDILFQREVEQAEEAWRKAGRGDGTSCCAAGAWSRPSSGSREMLVSCGLKSSSLSKPAAAGTEQTGSCDGIPSCS